MATAKKEIQETNTVDTTATELAALKEIVAEQQQRIEELEKKITTTKKEVVKPTKPKLPEEAFTVDGKQYKFLLPTFRLNRGGTSTRHTAEDAIKDKELLAYIVKNKLRIVIEVNATK